MGCYVSLGLRVSIPKGTLISQFLSFSPRYVPPVALFWLNSFLNLWLDSRLRAVILLVLLSWRHCFFYSFILFEPFHMYLCMKCDKSSEPMQVWDFILMEKLAGLRSLVEIILRTLKAWLFHSVLASGVANEKFEVWFHFQITHFFPFSKDFMFLSLSLGGSKMLQ